MEKQHLTWSGKPTQTHADHCHCQHCYVRQPLGKTTQWSVDSDLHSKSTAPWSSCWFAYPGRWYRARSPPVTPCGRIKHGGCRCLQAHTLTVGMKQREVAVHFWMRGRTGEETEGPSCKLWSRGWAAAKKRWHDSNAGQLWTNVGRWPSAAVKSNLPGYTGYPVLSANTLRAEEVRKRSPWWEGSVPRCSFPV